MPVKKIKSFSNEELVSYSDSAELLGELLTESEVPFEVGSFDNFVQTIFAKSMPQYNFNTWHVRKICAEIDNALMKPRNRYLEIVLPRYHLKSTIVGYGATIYRMLTSYGDGMYVSFKDELAQYHLGNIKKIIEDSKELSSVMTDLNPRSDTAIHYKVGSRKMKMFGSGIFAVKRGIHTDLVLIGDDLMGDLQNQLVLTEIEKAKRIFNAEVMNIPNAECPLFVFGTVIDYTDLLYSLKDNPSFTSIWLPALYPDAEHEVLWEEKFNKEILEERKAATGWKAFSTEFLLTPLMSTEAFVTRDELDKVIDKSLKNYTIPGWG
jgi:hypothetical protein